jgi:hypothetical protein
MLNLTEQLQGCKNLCRIVDFSEYTKIDPSTLQVYVVSEAFNANLLELYKTKKAENAEFSE